MNNIFELLGNRRENALTAAKFAMEKNIPLEAFGMKCETVKMKRTGSRKRQQNPAVPGMSDIIQQPLYSNAITLASAATSANNYTFFNATGPDLLTTNMEQPKALPRSFTYNATGLRVVVQGDINTINALIYSATLTFTVSGKYYAQGPLYLFPAAAGVSGVAATTVAATSLQAATNGLPVAGNVFDLRIPQGILLGKQQNPVTGETVTLISDGNQGVSILDGQNFQCDINFPTAVTLPAGSGCRVWVVLEGQLTRIVS